VSTALWVAAASHQHVYAILGDITFYHDMNGLLAVQRSSVSATFIVINNNGGGIFERLPIREFEPYHTDYFLTPHGLTFERAARLYGLEYALADDFASLDVALEAHVKSGVSSIIEVHTDIKADEAQRQSLVETVNQRVWQRLSE
jgi:2-succinyl-5-enolpyruvyl-6-hydroxy-3-cyclohexene-1-carboxylate synthase